LQQQLKPKVGSVVEIKQDAAMYHDGLADTQTTETEIPSMLDEISKPFHYQLNDGKKIGEHKGAHYFTIGQRKGLDIGGTPLPLFVIDTDVKENIIYTGQGENHPGLLRMGLFVKKEDIHWIRPDLGLAVGQKVKYAARIRYRQPLEKATLYMEEQGLYVIFDRPQKAIAAGQFVAWYLDDELLGSGVIN
jgi:tRNA-specific 2-thiouridylase